jgi:hypothetical protein
VKSSFCATSGCVEVDKDSNSDKVIVYDEFGNRCIFTHEEWKDFILGVKNHEFDV